MNSQTTFVLPLEREIEEAKNIECRTLNAFDELNEALADERKWYSALRDALDNYDVAETEELAETVLLAKEKEGILGGLAATSKAYDIVLSNLKNGLRKKGTGKLCRLWLAVENVRRSHEQAEVRLEQAQNRFTGLRGVCQLTAERLHASTRI